MKRLKVQIFYCPRDLFFFLKVNSSVVECWFPKPKDVGSKPPLLVFTKNFGWMAEWFMVLVLKTNVFKRTVGSNPTLSSFH
jgi:hypothetical protein